MNSTFDAKEAVKLMLDGLSVECIDGDFVFKLDDELGFYDISNEVRYDFVCFLQAFNNDHFKLENVNLVPWYRPVTYFDKNIQNPCTCDFARFDKDKNSFKTDKDIKFLEWETKFFPETWDQCE